MTAPAKTRNELLAALVEMHCGSGGCDSSRADGLTGHVSAGCRLAADLNALLAAERERCAMECDSFATSLDDRNDTEGEYMAEGALECASRLRWMK